MRRAEWIAEEVNDAIQRNAVSWRAGEPMQRLAPALILSAELDAVWHNDSSAGMYLRVTTVTGVDLDAELQGTIVDLVEFP